MTLLVPDPPNPIFSLEPQIKEKYPNLNGITAWKDSRGIWIYHFDAYDEIHQIEILDYARTLGEIP